MSMREFLEILLRKQGHEVTTAPDLAGALKTGYARAYLLFGDFSGLPQP